MHHTDYWKVAQIIAEKALAAAQAWDLNAAKTLRALSAEFDAMGDKAEREFAASVQAKIIDVIDHPEYWDGVEF